MIRRDCKDDEQLGWLLISQKEHARVSGDLARTWQWNVSADPSVNDEILKAIYHHDDGWEEWDQDGEFDSKSGKPISFTEMQLNETLPIWRKSIDSTKNIGILAGLIVSQHFCELLDDSRFVEDKKSNDYQLAHDFLNEQKPLQQDWTETWLSSSKERTEQQITVALKWLQFFDWISLYLCMKTRSEEYKLDHPAGQQVTFKPAKDLLFEISPWPLLDSQLKIQVSGRWIAEKKYLPDVQLSELLSEHRELLFSLEKQIL